MASILHGFLLVVWKNLVIRRRHWLLTLFEVLVPVLLFLVYAVAMAKVPIHSGEVMSGAVHYEQDSLAPNHRLDSTTLLYAPNSTFARTIMTRTQQKVHAKGLKAFASEKDLLDYYLAMKLEDELREPVFGVVFVGSEMQFTYKIRCSFGTWQTDRLFPISIPGTMDDSVMYFFNGFMALQNALDSSFISYISNSSDQFKVTTQKFPRPAFSMLDSTFGELNTHILPVLAVLSFVMLCPGILKRVVEEKESGIRELMKMMGLRGWMLWLGWVVNALLVNVISVSIIVFLLVTPLTRQSTCAVGNSSNCLLSYSSGGLLSHSSGSLMWVFLMLYCCAAVFFCLAISTLFSRPTLATSCGVIAWFLTYFVPLGMVQARGRVGLWTSLLTALLPNMAVNWGFQIIATFETRGVGLLWSNIWESPSGSVDDLSMLQVLLCLVLSCVAWGTLTWYVDAIMPGKYGIAKPWYFPVAWTVHQRGKVQSGMDCESLGGMQDQANFEKAPTDRKVGVEVRNLRKVFSSLCSESRKVAIDSVSIDIYAGSITALLGHNGAGKTTLISILTGLFSPSSGSVLVDGYSIVHQLDRVRASLGLCPQHNLLFPDLTILEHLLFFGRLKGLSRAEAEKQAHTLLSRFNIADKANKLTHTLSGGMKRKLSLAIALIGDSQVLILDEPTSGMDPEARREIWDLLLSMRGQRTILLTTHFMEEADVLGDRIAIMDHGRVHCYGTSLFLKKLYGTGYHLKVVKESSCDVHAVARLIQETVPNSVLKTDEPSKLCFMLPVEETSHFPAMFDVLETRKGELGVGSMGLSITTMEEVFLRVGEQAAEEHEADAESIHNSEKHDCSSSDKELNYKLEGLSLLSQQIQVLFFKKMMYTYRRWFLFLMKSLIPLVLAAMTVTFSIQAPSESITEPPLQLGLAGYHAEEVPFSLSADPGSPLQRLADEYGRLVGREPLPPGTSVTEYLLRLGEANIVKFREKLVVAAEFNATSSGKVEVNGLYSTVLLHAAPLSLNLVNNAVLRYLSNHSYSITTINHPLPVEQVNGTEMTEVGVMFLWLTLMPLGLLVLVAMFVVFPLEERVSQFKQLQLMANVCSPLYWAVCFLWDYFVYLAVTSLLVAVVYFCDRWHVFSGSSELGSLFLLMVLYGLSGIPFVYFFSYLKKTVAGGFVLLIVTNMLIGVVMCIVLFVLDVSGDATMKSVAEKLRYVLMLLPHFSLSHSLMHFSMQVVQNNHCRFMGAAVVKIVCERNRFSQCCPEGPVMQRQAYLGITSKDNPYGVGVEALYLAFSWLLYCALIVLLDYGVVVRLYERLLSALCTSKYASDHVDDDVLQEQERVDGFVKVGSRKDSGEDVMVLHGLKKTYGGRFTAVKGISFGVGHGDCFGLLGVNGAGKTSTFQMLTGAEVVTDGDAYISHWSLRNNTKKFLSQLGYCPQFDALNTSLTGREMLWLFAGLRGVPHEKLDHEVSYWIRRLGLEEHADRLCGTYSGGNKRKLSTALALVGDPQVVLLDEPTSGVDPAARRNLWGVLHEAQERDQAIVLTSHSMDECEALCRRLAIMVNGQFVCMGDIQYLKGKFGQGFTVLLKLHSSKPDTLVANVKQSFEALFQNSCVLKDEHQGLLQYHVTDPHVPWRRLFSSLEQLKEANAIVQDYTVSETTLEQVFLAFARAQKEVH